MFQIRKDDEGRYALVGRLDAAEADRAGGELRSIRSSAKLDCSELDYISSAGLGVLIELYKRLDGSGQTLTLVHLPSRVRNIFHYAGLDRLMNIE